MLSVRPAASPPTARSVSAIPIGDLRVPVHELGQGGVRLGLAPRSGQLEQLADLDLRRPFGLTDPPQPDLAARQRVGPGVDLARNSQEKAGLAA
jgi:hypothetical protein